MFIGRARDVVRKLNAAEIGKAESLDKIMTSPDSIFWKEKNTRPYLASKEFIPTREAIGRTIQN